MTNNELEPLWQTWRDARDSGNKNDTDAAWRELCDAKRRIVFQTLPERLIIPERARERRCISRPPRIVYHPYADELTLEGEAYIGGKNGRVWHIITDPVEKSHITTGRGNAKFYIDDLVSSREFNQEYPGYGLPEIFMTIEGSRVNATQR